MSGRPELQQRGVTAALGTTQILAWGSSYYLPAVLAKPISVATGWPLPWIVGGLSLGLLAAGLCSPMVGRAIERTGGRPVLASSSALLGTGLVALGLAPNLPAYLAAWLVIGVAMGAGLYDAAFATLGRLYGANARAAITNLTLLGGFASTVCWPLSAVFVQNFGWRGTCFIYAGLQFLVALPIHLRLLPRLLVPHATEPAGGEGAGPVQPEAEAADSPGRRILLPLLAMSLTVGTVIQSMISVHLLTILQARGLDLAAAVGLGAMVGPAQVAARVIEKLLGARFHPIWTMLVSTVLVASGLGLLWTELPVTAVALGLYGAGAGIFSIARGTLPLALFGAFGYAALMGRLAMPTLIAGALAPSAGALLLDRISAGSTLAALTGLAAANIALIVGLRLLLGRRKRPPAPSSGGRI